MHRLSSQINLRASFLNVCFASKKVVTRVCFGFDLGRTIVDCRAFPGCVTTRDVLRTAGGLSSMLSSESHAAGDSVSNDRSSFEGLSHGPGCSEFSSML